MTVPVQPEPVQPEPVQPEPALRRPGVAATSRVTVRPHETVLDGRLESFLTARWGLHVAHLGRTWYLPNTHVTWPLRAAEVVELSP